MEQSQVTKNLLIRASAGTGKTFSIATRFIWLFIVQGVDVKSILALTFSRLAAQEIYTKILERLWKASYRNENAITEDEKEAGAKEERQNILEYIFGEGCYPTQSEIKAALKDHLLDAKEFSLYLRKLLNTQHLGTIATLDSFILKFVRSYPLELGFQNNVSLVEEYQEKAAVSEANDELLKHSKDGMTILEDFQTLEQRWLRSIRAKVVGQADGGWREFVRNHKTNLPTVEGMKKVLGVPDQLQSFGAPGGLISTIDLKAIADAARSSSTGKSLGGNATRWVLNPLVTLKEILSNYTGEAVLASDGAFLGTLLTSVRTNTLTTHFIFGKSEVDLTDEAIAAFTADIHRADNLFLTKCIEKSVKRLHLVKRIDDVYDAQMRRAGKLTFSDLPEAQKNFAWDTDEEKFKADLENLYYRFDSKFDHWALDEFQDTSDVQWSCLRALVEDAANDATKSVVTVGDLKQAIYAWRGGSNVPFQDMMGWPAISGFDVNGRELEPIFGATKIGQIQNKDVSRRYEKNVCDFINLIFREENLAPLLQSRPEALANWIDPNCWREHEALRNKETGKIKDSDYVKVIGVPVAVVRGQIDAGTDDDKDIDKKAILPLVPSLVRELSALWQTHKDTGSRETVGILVRGNNEGSAWAKYLRREGFPVIWEGLSGVRDWPVVELLLALLTLSEHPEDTAAWQFIKASPLPEILSSKSVLPLQAFDSVDALSSAVAKSLSEIGLSRTVQKYLNPIKERLRAEEDLLSIAHLAGLMRAAVLYEAMAKPGDGIDVFKTYLESHVGRELAASSDFIRILTIHRSKGLGIDHVFVPFAETSKTDFLSSKNKGAFVSEKSGEWILSGLDEASVLMRPVFKELWDKRQEIATSENLHTYYVALTRAKKSMYVILPLLTSKDGELKNKGFSRVIIEALWQGRTSNEEVIREFGAKVICQKPKEKVDVIPIVSSVGFNQDISSRQDEYKRVSPSGEFRGKAIDQAKGGGASSAARNPFAEDFGADAQAGIEKHAELEKEDWRNPREENKWAAPAEGWTEIWQEKAFEFVEEKVWFSGKIDRVTFYPDGCVVIADYKFSDKTDDELRAAYTSQLRTYARAVRKLTGQTNISAQLLVSSSSTFHHRVIDINLI